MPRYRVEVATASHDDLRAGRLESRVSVVAVTASCAGFLGDTEAVQLACQVAACTSGHMPTRAELLDFPT